MGATFSVINPADGKSFATAPDATIDDARRAADVASGAFGTWGHTTAYERADVLRKWHARIVAQAEEIAQLMTREMGKPITESRGEVKYAAGFVEWYAEEAKRVYGTTVPSQFAHKRILVSKQPVGPVYAITPWNFPAGMVTRKVAPALAAGCTCILKPAEQTPLTAMRLHDLWIDAGGSAEVFQVITAADPVPITSVFMHDPRIRKITFTGSTEVGKLLYAQSAETMKRLSLELGGHAPFLVCEDADMPAAVREVIAAKFRNTGQTCICPNRIYVDAKIAAPFIDALAAAVRALRVGPPNGDGTQIGPLVDAQGLSKVIAHMDDARAKGARIVTGGHALEGLYFEPTVLTGVRPGMRMLEEETFGPVAPVMTFTTEAEAIALANATPYGLAAYLWTRDMSRAFRLSEALDYGIIGVNDGVPSTPQAPFGGFKNSGLGREGGLWGIDEYLEIKYTSIGLNS